MESKWKRQEVKEMSGHEMRKSALRRYIVFRVKAIEFLDLLVLMNSLLKVGGQGTLPLPSFPPNRHSRFVANSIRTVVLSWLPCSSIRARTCCACESRSPTPWSRRRSPVPPCFGYSHDPTRSITHGDFRSSETSLAEQHNGLCPSVL